LRVGNRDHRGDLGLTPPGYDLPPLRGWQTSRWGDSVAFAQ